MQTVWHKKYYNSRQKVVVSSLAKIPFCPYVAGERKHDFHFEVELYPKKFPFLSEWIRQRVVRKFYAFARPLVKLIEKALLESSGVFEVIMSKQSYALQQS